MGWQGWGQAFGRQGNWEEVWHSIGTLILQTSQYRLHFFSAMSSWADAKGLRRGLGAGLGRLSMAPLTAGFPACSTLTAILGAGPLLTFEGIFLLLFPLTVLLHLSCLLLLEFQMGAYCLQDSFSISPLFSHHVHLSSLSSQFEAVTHSH